MDELKGITVELDKEVQKAKGNMFASKLIAPLRLVLVWMNGVNQKLAELEQRGGGHF
ncbi:MULTISPECIES: hypothetical protein [Photobacterium]|uniref:Uncharacterized protein n=1 Tax=Photobacterium profundum 3TCK TaxID=314280 RepID=Q1Z9E0_9GAMM|nr:MULTISPECIES: hypothetical protein [Photobacterium]EAS44818.1 hypothetical protein P3TCK_20080 [Photobacterium profundum 3TCK]